MTAHNAGDRPTNERGSYLTRGLAIALITLGFLPIANWIDAGHAAPWYAAVAQSWLTGTAIVAGAAVVLIILTRRRVVPFASRIADRAAARFYARPGLALALLALVATALYAITALLVFSGRPLFIDEIVQLYQARLFKAGYVADPVGPFPEFFGALNVVSVDGRQFGQFPPGGPAHLLLGVLIGAPWLITPVIGGLAVLVFGLLVRRVEHEPTVALGAILLFAFSPFMLFMSASHMNHGSTLLWVLVAWWAWSYLTSDIPAHAGWALLFGLAAGIAASIRPVDALAMIAPAGIVLLRRMIRQRQMHWFAMVCVGAALPGALFLAFNAATTGSPFLFGYEAGWGKAHSLGFHRAPWGVTHTPARGIELLNLYVLRLQSYLFETPIPSLLPVITTLFFLKRSSEFDRVMLWSCVLLAAGYFAYWHDGFYLGPRFFFVLLPALALLAARAPRATSDALRTPALRSYTFFMLALSFIIALATGVPQRARLYAQSLTNSRHRLTSPAESLGIRDAVIFVRESWGSQVLARLWGRHILASEAELLYRNVDTCQLDAALTRLERYGATGEAARTALWPLLGDSAAVRPTTLSPDYTERVGREPYSPHCLQRAIQDRQGMALYPLVLAQERGSNIYARDLGARNVVLQQRYPERPAFVLVPRSLGSDQYVLQPISR